MRRFLPLLAVALFAALALAACSDDEKMGETPTPSDGGQETATGGQVTPTAAVGATTVNVTLQEYSVIPAAASAPAGDVTFSATNSGAEDHELVVVKSDLDPGALPTKEDGSIDEAQVDVIGEIEPFAAGSTEQAAFNLDAGAYVLLCNIVDKEGDAHYKLGMRIGLAVE
jgi:hypothetical protein